MASKNPKQAPRSRLQSKKITSAIRKSNESSLTPNRSESGEVIDSFGTDVNRGTSSMEKPPLPQRESRLNLAMEVLKEAEQSVKSSKLTKVKKSTTHSGALKKPSLTKKPSSTKKPVPQDAAAGYGDDAQAWVEENGEYERRSYRGSWYDFEPSKPIKVEGGFVTASKKGAIGDTWWSKRFLSSLEGGESPSRLARGRTYARQGQVVGLEISAGSIVATVQGSRSTPYQVRITTPVIEDQTWDRVADLLVIESGKIAHLLAGNLPLDIESLFESVGETLFPADGREYATECTCPDWSNPCKHIAAVYYLCAEAFDRDPFMVFEWRGKDRHVLLDHLRQLRLKSTPNPTTAASLNLERSSFKPPTATFDSRPLSDDLDRYWTAGSELFDLNIRPKLSEVPGALLHQLPRGILEIDGRDIVEVLEPYYVKIAKAAQKRAFNA